MVVLSLSDLPRKPVHVPVDRVRMVSSVDR